LGDWVKASGGSKTNTIGGIWVAIESISRPLAITLNNGALSLDNWAKALKNRALTLSNRAKSLGDWVKSLSNWVQAIILSLDGGHQADSEESLDHDASTPDTE